MAVSSRRRGGEIEILDDLKVKRLYDEYRQMKALLDYIRRPETQEMLQTMKGYVPDLSRKLGTKRRSRI
jgi:hypothetical protein